MGSNLMLGQQQGIHICANLVYKATSSGHHGCCRQRMSCHLPGCIGIMAQEAREREAFLHRLQMRRGCPVCVDDQLWVRQQDVLQLALICEVAVDTVAAFQRSPVDCPVWQR